MKELILSVNTGGETYFHFQVNVYEGGNAYIDNVFIMISDVNIVDSDYCTDFPQDIFNGLDKIGKFTKKNTTHAKKYFVEVDLLSGNKTLTEILNEEVEILLSLDKENE
jgi:hypothetical protein